MDLLRRLIEEVWGSIWPQWSAAAFAFFLIFIGQRWLKRRKVQARGFDRKQLWFEVRWSAFLLTCTSSLGFCLQYLDDHGLAKIDSGPVSPWVVLGQFALYFVTFDAYFYFLHRALHWRPLYWIHKVHHRSATPDPLSAFSFHPIEGLLTGGYVIFTVAVLHFHLYAVIATSAYGVINSLLIHSGYEVFPRWWYQHPLTRWYLTPMFHDRHHSKYLYNFGGFTTVWDRVFGTMLPAFDAEYLALHTRGEQTVADPPPA